MMAALGVAIGLVAVKALDLDSNGCSDGVPASTGYCADAKHVLKIENGAAVCRCKS